MGYATVHGGDAADPIGALLPAGVVAVEAVGPVAPDELFGDEAKAVARAVESRQLEFARGRSCARRALAELGVAPGAIPMDLGRAPIWPSGFIGSITHCHGYCCAAVAAAGELRTLGIDAEVLQPLSPEIQHMIMRDDERQRLAELPPTAPWACVVFSAKEAVYKAWYPLAKRWLDFHDVDLRLDLSRGCFEAISRLEPSTLPHGWPVVLPGRFALHEGRVVATCAV